MLASKSAITQANRTYILNKSFVLQRHTLKSLNVANWLLRIYRHQLLQQSAFYHPPPASLARKNQVASSG